MKTSENENKFSNFTQHRIEILRKERIDDAPINESLNAERIITTYKNTKKIYYDNSAISMSFGQYNLEKCLFILLFLIIYSTYIAYSYLDILDKTNLTFLIAGGVIDLIVSLIYLYLLVKLRSDTIFNEIPIGIMNISDYIIILNCFVKMITLIMAVVSYNLIGLLGIIIFSIKFLFDSYFVVVSVKLFMFCPCSLYVQEQTERIWNGIIYYIFCCEYERKENTEYTRLEDLESFE